MNRICSAAISGVLTLAAGAASAGVMLGAHVGSENDVNSQQEFTDFENQVGRKLAIDNDHEDWNVFPNVARVRWDAQNGRLSMLSWRIIFHRNNPGGGCATADAIAAGKYDAQLRRQAEAAKSVGRDFLVRFNYEMTSNEENTCFTGFAVKSNPAPAGAKYIAAWRHVVDLFRAAGANNVKWVWAPGQGAFAGGIWRMFYPGDTYVDWIGVDYYNKGDKPKDFASGPGIVAFYSQTASLGKPLIISETAAVGDPRLNPDPQTLWLNSARQFVKSRPAIKALVWWNDPGKFAKRATDYGGSGYVLQGPGLAAFKAMAFDPYFK